MVPALSLAVVGVLHPNADKSNRLHETLLCKPGDPVFLVPEPTNAVDPNAVAVFSEREIQIGYVTAERCGRIGALIRSGMEVQAVFQVSAPFGSWIRVAFDGEVPVVDPDAQPIKARELVRDGVDPDPEFEPDPEWPD